MTLAPLHGLHVAHSGPSTQLPVPPRANSGSYLHYAALMLSDADDALFLRSVH